MQEAKIWKTSVTHTNLSVNLSLFVFKNLAMMLRLTAALGLLPTAAGNSVAANTTATTIVTVGTDVVSAIDPRFASVTHDIQDFIGYNIAPWDFDWSSTQLRNLVGALAPMTVRCGGTWEDGIFWEDGPQTGRFAGIPRSMAAHNLTATAWDPFARFMNGLPGIDLVVGLGALWRHWGACDVPPDATCPGEIPWDSRNAEAFMRHNSELGHRVFAYELGNEPAVWNYTWKTPIVTPAQHAPDYAALRAVIRKVHGAAAPAPTPAPTAAAGGVGPASPSASASASVPQVVGPDTTWGPVGDELPDGGRNPMPGQGGPNADYWGASLRAGADVDIAAFHYYGIQPGIVRDWRSFVNTARDGSVCSAVAAHAKDLAESPLAGKAQLWLGEGGASYGGFGHDVKGDDWLRLFGGALSYAENLGCAATNGARVFARQQLSNFISGKRESKRWAFTPMPTWWVARLWTKLVGIEVLHASVDGGEGYIHAFALRGAAGLAPAGSRTAAAAAAARNVAVLVNWDEQEARTSSVAVSGCVGGGTADVYVLTPAGAIDAADDDSTGDAAPRAKSQGIALNGRELRTDADGNVPQGALQPATVQCAGGTARVELTGLTAAFVVL